MEAYFAGGCFWCITPFFKRFDGVKEVVAGYSGGEEANPTYEEVKKQLTHHRETIEVVYDENIISYEKLLEVFFANVDLYDGGGQFIDRGHSYTLAVYYINDEQKQLTENKINSYPDKVYVALEKFKSFYKAEEYHQDFYLKNPEAFAKEMIESGRKK